MINLNLSNLKRQINNLSEEEKLELIEFLKPNEPKVVSNNECKPKFCIKCDSELDDLDGIDLCLFCMTK